MFQRILFATDFSDAAEDAWEVACDLARTHRTVSAESIVDTATEEGADLIVIGTHGRTGLTRLVIGSVAERVVRIAPCLVRIVKPPAPREIRQAAA